MLYRSKNEGKSLDERVEDMVEKMIAITKRDYPMLHQLMFRCDRDQLVALRRTLSFLWGVTAGFLIYLAVGSHWTESKIAAAMLVVIVAVGFTLSVQCRCIVLLIFPTLLTGIGKTFFYLLLFKFMFGSVLFIKFKTALSNLIMMSSCFMKFRIYLMTWKFRLQLYPFLSSFLDVLEEKGLQKLFPKSSSGEGAMQSLFAQVKEISVCKDVRESVANNCADQIVNSILGRITIFGMPWIGNWIAKQICDLSIGKLADTACSKMEEQFKKIQNEIHNGVNDVVKSNSETKVWLTFPENQWTRTKQWDSFEEVRGDLLSDASIGLSFLYSSSKFVDILVLIIFFIGVLCANTYHRKYLTSLEHDNFYVDRYFRKIDQRRKVKKKIHLLPLRGVDQQELISLFSPKMSNLEYNATYIGNGFKIAIITMMVLLIFINFLLIDFVNLTSEQLNFVYNVTVEQEFNPEFKSFTNKENFLTKPLQNIVGIFKYNKITSKWRFDLNQCAYFQDHLDNLDYVTLLLSIGFLVATLKFSIYVLRTRKIICDYFYHRYSKERTLNLYNDRLRMRKQYLNERIEQLRSLIEAHKMLGYDFDYYHTFGRKTFPQSEPFLKRFILSYYDSMLIKQCFMCNRPIVKPFISCDKTTCKLLYHEVCYADAGNRCINCGTKEKNSRFILLVD